MIIYGDYTYETALDMVLECDYRIIYETGASEFGFIEWFGW